MFKFLKNIFKAEENNTVIKSSKMNGNQLVCKCKNVTVNDLENAVKNGAKSFEEVQDITKVSTGCRGCTDHAKAIVNDLLKDNELVCNCMKVTVKDIKNAVKGGAKSFEEVQKITKVSTGCGGCTNKAKALVSELLLVK